MKNTHFHDDYTEPISNRATGYYPAGKSKYRLFLSTFDCVGSGGLFSSVQDLFLWDQNFYHHKVGGKEVHDMMHTNGKLNSGEELDYAFALMQSEYKGLKTVRHGGALGGYRAELLRFPEQRFSVICLSNLSSFNPSGMCNKVADIYLTDKLTAEEPKTGEYYSDELAVNFTLAAKKDKLCFVTQNAPENPLRHLKKDEFAGDRFKINFLRDSSNKVVAFALSTGRVKNLKFVKN